MPTNDDSRARPAENQGGKLVSWKEIGAYLDKSPRTAMRWAEERGLPIRRVPGGKGPASVYAYAHELDAWLVVSGTAPPVAEGSPRAGRWLWPGILAGLGLAGVLAFVAFYLFRPGEPVRVSLAGNKLLAWDRKDRLIWEYGFEEAIEPPAQDQMARRILVADLDGDGSPEVLANLTLVADTASGYGNRMYCLSDQGKLRWRYQPQDTLRFSGRAYTGPWHFKDVLVTSGKGPKQIWAAVSHHTWWPAFVVRVNPRTGHATRLFVNSGSIYALSHVRTATGPFLLAAGVNNDYRSAILAVLRDGDPLAVSPQPPGSSRVCDDCPPNPPYRYFLCPPTDVLAAGSPVPYNEAYCIRVHPDRIQVWTKEHVPIVHVIYELTYTFDPIGRFLGAGFEPAHQRLEREGKLNHAARDCPDRIRPTRVKMFERERGWIEVPVGAG